MAFIKDPVNILLRLAVVMAHGFLKKGPHFSSHSPFKLDGVLDYRRGGGILENRISSLNPPRAKFKKGGFEGGVGL